MIRLYDGIVREMSGVPVDSTTYAQTVSGSIAVLQNSSLGMGMGMGMCTLEFSCDCGPSTEFPNVLPWRTRQIF